MSAVIYEIADRYDSGKPKSYRDVRTGEVLTLRQYRERREQERESGGIAAPPRPPLDFHARVGAAPPPRPVGAPALSGADGASADAPAGEEEYAGEEEGGPVGLAEGVIAPTLTTLCYALAQLGLRGAAAELLPPMELVGGILPPLGRIADRHLPILTSLSEDGEDLAEALGMLGALGSWYIVAFQRYGRRIRRGGMVDATGTGAGEYVGGSYHGRDGGGGGPAAAAAGGDGRGGDAHPNAPILGLSARPFAPGSRAAAAAVPRTGADAGADNTGASPDGFGGDVAWKASRVRDILAASAEGARLRGLQ